MQNRCHAFILAPLLVLNAFTATASSSYQDWENWLSSANAVLPQESNKGSLKANLAIGSAIAPDYYGGKTFGGKPLLLLEANYRNKVFVSTQQGFGFNLWQTRTMRMGPRITIDAGRKSTDSNRLRLLPDVDPSVEFGLFVESFNGPWRFRGDVRKDLTGGHEGSLLNLDIGHGVRWGPNSSLVFGFKTVFMDSDYAENYFGVPVTNAGGELTPFTAEGGFRDAQGYMQIIYDVNKKFYISFEGRGTYLFSAVTDSPITETTDFFSGSILTGFRF